MLICWKLKKKNFFIAAIFINKSFKCSLSVPIQTLKSLITSTCITLLLNHFYYFPPDKPSKPKLTSTNSSPTDGDHMTLTCNVQNSAVTKFEFYRGGRLISGSGTGKTFTDNSVTFSDAGSYTCKAFIDSVVSDSSDGVNVKGLIASLFHIFVACNFCLT